MKPQIDGRKTLVSFLEWYFFRCKGDFECSGTEMVNLWVHVLWYGWQNLSFSQLILYIYIPWSIGFSHVLTILTPYWFVILFVGSKIFFVTKLPTANNAFVSSLGSFFYTKSKSLGNLQWQKPRTLRQILFELGRMINKHPQILNLKMLRLHLYISFVCVFWWLDRPWGKNCFYVLKMPGEMTKH